MITSSLCNEGYREDNDDEENKKKEGQYPSKGSENVQHGGSKAFEFANNKDNHNNFGLSFLTIQEIVKIEYMRYATMDGEDCDTSNNLNLEHPIKPSLVQYHFTSLPQFENVENIGNVVSSDWIP